MVIFLHFATSFVSSTSLISSDYPTEDLYCKSCAFLPPIERFLYWSIAGTVKHGHPKNGAPLLGTRQPGRPGNEKEPPENGTAHRSQRSWRSLPSLRLLRGGHEVLRDILRGDAFCICVSPHPLHIERFVRAGHDAQLADEPRRKDGGIKPVAKAFLQPKVLFPRKIRSPADLPLEDCSCPPFERKIIERRNSSHLVMEYRPMETFPVLRRRHRSGRKRTRDPSYRPRHARHHFDGLARELPQAHRIADELDIIPGKIDHFRRRFGLHGTSLLRFGTAPCRNAGDMISFFAPMSKNPASAGIFDADYFFLRVLDFAASIAFFASRRFFVFLLRGTLLLSHPDLRFAMIMMVSYGSHHIRTRGKSKSHGNDPQKGYLSEDGWRNTRQLISSKI